MISSSALWYGFVWERNAIVLPPVPEMVAHLVLKSLKEAEQLWLIFRVEWRHKSWFVSVVVHFLQAHLIHSAMTLFQPAPRSSSFSRSLVDSSCPNHQTPCWGTVERYKDTSTQMRSCSFSLPFPPFLSYSPNYHKTKWNSLPFSCTDYWSICRSGDHRPASGLL